MSVPTPRLCPACGDTVGRYEDTRRLTCPPCQLYSGNGPVCYVWYRDYADIDQTSNWAVEWTILTTIVYNAGMWQPTEPHSRVVIVNDVLEVPGGVILKWLATLPLLPFSVTWEEVQRLMVLQ